MLKTLLSKLFGNQNSTKNKEAKDFILKEFFNSKNQKRAVMRAAKESAEDQKMLMRKYNELVKE